MAEHPGLAVSLVMRTVVPARRFGVLQLIVAAVVVVAADLPMLDAVASAAWWPLQRLARCRPWLHVLGPAVSLVMRAVAPARILCCRDRVRCGDRRWQVSVPKVASMSSIQSSQVQLRADKIHLAKPRAATRKPDTFAGWLGKLSRDVGRNIMENDGPDQQFWWYNTSGDWLTLAEAAEVVSAELQAKKTAIDILKAGYISYLDFEVRLPLYVPVQQPRLLKSAAHVDSARLPSYLHQNLLFAGDVFQLHPEAIERLVLLGYVDSSLCSWMALGVIFSDKSVSGWIEQVDWVDKCRTWHISCAYAVEPDLRILVNDIRVDGEDLRGFIEKARTARAVPVIADEVEDLIEAAPLIEVRTPSPATETPISYPTCESPSSNNGELSEQLKEAKARLAEYGRIKREQTRKAVEARKANSKEPSIRAWFLALELQGENLAERHMAGKIAMKFSVTPTRVREIRSAYFTEKAEKAKLSSVSIV